MVKRKEPTTIDTPRRRSKRLMKLKADVDPPEDFCQQSNDPSSAVLLPPENLFENSDSITGNDDNNNLEALAMDVFKNMKCMLTNSLASASKPTPSTEHQSEMLMLESIKTPSKKIQL